MKEKLSTTLSLETTECIRGESVWFNVVIRNDGEAALKDVPTLDPHNEALFVEAVSSSRHFKATQRGLALRQGLYAHGPRDDRVTVLPIGGTLQLREDLLAFLGELPPGDYEVSATYTGVALPVQSARARLRVLPANPIWLGTPRFGERNPKAPMTAAWIHRFPSGGPNAGKMVLFYQMQSQNLPRCPLHGVRIGLLEKPISGVFAASQPTPASDFGHVVWADSSSNIFAGSVDVIHPQLQPPMAVKAPFRGAPLDSPLTTSSGELLMPFADVPRTRAALLCLARGEPMQTIEVPLGAHAPFGPSFWLWGYDVRLHLSWAKPRGRELFYSRLPLDDRAAGFSTPMPFAFDDPILWIDGYLDADAPAQRKPGTADVSPDTVFWLILERPRQLVLVRFNVALHASDTVAVLPTEALGKVEVLGSAVAQDHHLAILLRDQRGQIHYASSATRDIRSLAQITPEPVSAEQFPTLIPAGGDAVAPWVFLRYADLKDGCIRFLKLEPASKKDPMDSLPAEPQHLPQ